MAQSWWQWLRGWWNIATIGGFSRLYRLRQNLKNPSTTSFAQSPCAASWDDADGRGGLSFYDNVFHQAPATTYPGRCILHIEPICRWCVVGSKKVRPRRRHHDFRSDISVQRVDFVTDWEPTPPATVVSAYRTARNELLDAWCRARRCHLHLMRRWIIPPLRPCPKTAA